MGSDVYYALKPLTGLKEFKYAVWDIEATDWWNLEVIGVWDGSQYYWFRNVDDFLNHILQRKYRDWRFFAHFGGRYDFNFIFDRLRNRPDYRVEFYCSGSMVLKMTIEKGDSCVHLCDSYRLLPAKLADLCESFDVVHKKQRFDFLQMTFNRELLEYNECDCRGLYEVLTSFFEQTGIRSETFATHALRVFRKDFLSRVIYKPSADVSAFIRESYFGGRVEVIKRGGNLNCYDVNSMYPYVMQFPVPVDYIGESRKLKETNYGFVHCDVQVPAEYVPVLPTRFEKLYFPCGKITGTWTNAELVCAIARGTKVIKVHRAVYFKAEPLFGGYVERLYTLKRTATEPTRTIAKYLLNSLYGKFGQNPEKKVYVSERDAPQGSLPILNPNGAPSGFAYYMRRSEAAYLLPHLASAITSAARLHLLTNLNERAYYCDTDSVFTTDEVSTSEEIGQWGKVGYGDFTFYQPKLYSMSGYWKDKEGKYERVDNKWKAKGLNLAQDISVFVSGGVNEVVRKRSIKEALNQGLPACADINVSKRMGTYRPKRAWIGDDTRPWNTKELKK